MNYSLDKRTTAAINHCFYALKQHIQADVLFPSRVHKISDMKITFCK
ncbi:hypothetical protein D083_2848 [Dickeya solani RNS 08.23.3.1.A]|nr:hypothetical protein D083_2848 [Dickeya solani RNS 08.23.3.1.A]